MRQSSGKHSRVSLGSSDKACVDIRISALEDFTAILPAFGNSVLLIKELDEGLCVLPPIFRTRVERDSYG